MNGLAGNRITIDQDGGITEASWEARGLGCHDVRITGLYRQGLEAVQKICRHDQQALVQAALSMQPSMLQVGTGQMPSNLKAAMVVRHLLR